MRSTSKAEALQRHVGDAAMVPEWLHKAVTRGTQGILPKCTKWRRLGETEVLLALWPGWPTAQGPAALLRLARAL